MLNRLDYLIRFARRDPYPLFLTDENKYIFYKEWREWKKEYVPFNGDLKNKTVLDVGAGQGETVYFFLKHGARSVTAVEPDSRKAHILRKNVRKNGWPVKVIEAPFSLQMLETKYDFVKIDCEGCEYLLLMIGDKRPPVPCSIEIHNEAIAHFLGALYASWGISHILKRKYLLNHTWILRAWI